MLKKVTLLRKRLKFYHSIKFQVAHKYIFEIKIKDKT